MSLYYIHWVLRLRVLVLLYVLRVLRVKRLALSIRSFALSYLLFEPSLTPSPLPPAWSPYMAIKCASASASSQWSKEEFGGGQHGNAQPIPDDAASNTRAHKSGSSSCGITHADNQPSHGTTWDGDGARAFEGDEAMANLRAHPQWQWSHVSPPPPPPG